MKCFLLGLMGSFSFFVIYLIVSAEYSDYRARTETVEWLIRLEPIQKIIEQNAVKSKTLFGAGNGVDKNKLQTENSGIDVFKVTESGVIVLRGGREGQAITMIPSVENGNIMWLCIGGPAHAMPKQCKQA